jgi:hypothetical protein
MSEKIISELKQVIGIVEQFDKDSAQDATVLHAYLIDLTNFMARANLLMAEYGRAFRQAKKQAYINLKASEGAQGNKKFSVMLAKDYVDSCCSESAYIYDLAERTSRLCTHTIDALRTILSSLKSERQFASYG